MKKRRINPPKVEFYVCLPEIKKLYSEGYVFAKTIYKKLIDTKKITMSYTQFTVYFKREVTDKPVTGSTPKNGSVGLISSEPIQSDQTEAATTKRDPQPGDDDWEPMSFKVGGTTQKKFNPHANGIDEKNIL